MAEIRFPIKGIHKGAPVTAQPTGTSPRMNNMRAFDKDEGKVRGGQRPGLDKLYTDQINATDAPVVAICTVTKVI